MKNPSKPTKKKLKPGTRKFIVAIPAHNLSIKERFDLACKARRLRGGRKLKSFNPLLDD